MKDDEKPLYFIIGTCFAWYVQQESSTEAQRLIRGLKEMEKQKAQKAHRVEP